MKYFKDFLLEYNISSEKQFVVIINRGGYNRQAFFPSTENPKVYSLKAAVKIAHEYNSEAKSYSYGTAHVKPLNQALHYVTGKADRPIKDLQQKYSIEPREKEDNPDLDKKIKSIESKLEK